MSSSAKYSGLLLPLGVACMIHVQVYTSYTRYIAGDRVDPHFAHNDYRPI